MGATQVIDSGQLAALLNCSPQQLADWSALLPSPTASGFSVDALTVERLRQQTAVLKSGMTVEQVKELTERDRSGKLLARYALLAEDCPANVTAHMLRSLCVVILAQNRQGRMLTPSQLAQAAGLDLETAKRHLRILQAVGLLHASEERDRWEFAFVPRAISGN